MYRLYKAITWFIKIYWNTDMTFKEVIYEVQGNLAALDEAEEHFKQKGE